METEIISVQEMNKFNIPYACSDRQIDFNGNFYGILEQGGILSIYKYNSKDNYVIKDGINSFSFHSKFNIIIAGLNNSKIKLYEILENVEYKSEEICSFVVQEKFTFDYSDNQIGLIKFNPINDYLIASASNFNLLIFNLNKEFDIINMKSDKIICEIEWSLNNDKIIAYFIKFKIHILNIEKKEILHIFDVSNFLFIIIDFNKYIYIKNDEVNNNNVIYKDENNENVVLIKSKEKIINLFFNIYLYIIFYYKIKIFELETNKEIYEFKFNNLIIKSEMILSFEKDVICKIFLLNDINNLSIINIKNRIFA